MITTPVTQRTYQTHCSNCGAITLFRAASTTHTVCSYCSSTITRSGEVLGNRGTVANVFEDYSLLQIGTQGQFQGINFTLIGRVQYEASAGRWTEWLVLLDNKLDSIDNTADDRDITAILSEDNGSYVWMQPSVYLISTNIPSVNSLNLGKIIPYLNNSYVVSAVYQARLIAAQGECGQLSILNTSFDYVELRNHKGQLLTLSYDTSNKNPTIYLGEAIDLSVLKLTGLKNSASIATLSGQSFDCPNCGSPVTILLDSSKSITCKSCNSLIDLSQGLGAQLAYALQAEPIKPQISLGSLTMIAGKSWQMTGYQHRITLIDQNSIDDEQEGWEEYLLYNAQLGFQFLINSNEGWSLVRPITGVPSLLSNGSVSYLGRIYPPAPRYSACTEFVLGEFYWPLKRNDKTFNQDFSVNQYRLNCEQNTQETIWSAGQTLSAKAVIQMFNISADQAKHFRSDITPFGLTANTLKWAVIIVSVLALIVIEIKADSPKEACQKQFNPYSTLSAEQQMQQCLARHQQRSRSGGSYGGFYMGSGGHK
jgi:ribosomal protein S27E